MTDPELESIIALLRAEYRGEALDQGEADELKRFASLALKVTNPNDEYLAAAERNITVDDWRAELERTLLDYSRGLTAVRSKLIACQCRDLSVAGRYTGAMATDAKARYQRSVDQ